MPINTVGIGGEPATGKTSLMVQILKRLGASRGLYKGLVRGHFYDLSQVVVLGVYDGSLFSGTDRLSMAVLPEAIAFLNKIANRPAYDNWTVLFEGDRLFNAKFFDAAQQLGELKLFLLTCEEETLEKRHSDRKDTQSESWLKGRRTKYAKLYAQYPMTMLSNDTLEMQKQNFEAIYRAIGDRSIASLS